ncbi:MAG: hypothetical protein LC791_14055 [Acidobacteria bacterium]|nr:hypothetical protein [Acidobacteriota bacterium]
MCGICGMVGFPQRQIVTRVTATMAHRAPDAGGFHVDDAIALGFRRLSIVDKAMMLFDAQAAADVAGDEPCRRGLTSGRQRPVT